MYYYLPSVCFALVFFLVVKKNKLVNSKEGKRKKKLYNEAKTCNPAYNTKLYNNTSNYKQERRKQIKMDYVLLCKNNGKYVFMLAGFFL